MKGVKTQGKDPPRSKDPFAEKEGLKHLPKTQVTHRLKAASSQFFTKFSLSLRKLGAHRAKFLSQLFDQSLLATGPQHFS